MSNFWLPAVEVTDDLIADLAAKSGVPGAGREAFRFSLEFADRGQRSTCTIGTRWRGAPDAIAPDGSLNPEADWITFAIVESGSQFVVWALDVGDEDRVGEGWKIAARIPNTSTVSAQGSFPRSGFPVSFVRRREDS